MAEFKGNAKLYRPQHNAYRKQWYAKQPPDSKTKTYKLSAEQKAKKAEYQRKRRAANRTGANEYANKWRKAHAAGVNEKARNRYAIRGKTTAQARRDAQAKATHIRNRELLAARPKPDQCDVCGSAQGGIVFDHCHKTLNFRGWLCNGCNRALGFVNDDASRLRMLAAYLDRTKNGQSPQLVIPGL